MVANRNGFFYVLDRTNGQFILGKPYMKLTWASGLDANGRPIEIENQRVGVIWGIGRCRRCMKRCRTQLPEVK